MKRLWILPGVFILGMGLMWYWMKPKEQQMEEQATVIVEQMKKVAKLVTVEGYFVEHYDYGDPHPGPYFIGPFPNWSAFLPRKEAHIRMKAKVLVGYDLEQLKIESHPEEKRIYLSNLPEPEILAIETEIDLFDDNSSIFRPLTEEDHLQIYRGARKKIEQATAKSDLLKAAEEQGNEMIGLMRFIAEQAGWELIESPNTLDTLQYEEKQAPSFDSSAGGTIWQEGTY